MSGELMRAPQNVDEDIDLQADSLPVNAQMKFLHEFCVAHPANDYMYFAPVLYLWIRDARK